MNITNEAFRKLANFFFKDEKRGKLFREACESVGINLQLSVEEMRTSLRNFHKRNIERLSTKINLIKDVTLPNIERNIKELEEKGLSAIRIFRGNTFRASNRSGVVDYPVKDGRIIATHSTYNVCALNKVYLVVDNWESLSKNMKSQFWRMQRTLFRFDRFLVQKDLKEFRKQLAYSRRIVEKLDRLSEEEVKVYYQKMVEDDLDKSKNCE
jgi:hypothetical protein